MSDPQWETMSDQQRFERLKERLKEQVYRLKTQVQNLEVKNEALFHRLRDAEEKIDRTSNRIFPPPS
jgi:peptidoglycan hydrolase CwlO-like protein